MHYRAERLTGMGGNILLKIGCLVLSLWSALNLLASLLVVLIPVVFFGEIAPALIDSLSDSEVLNLNDSVVRNANGIAVFANGVNIAFCSIMLIAIWHGLYRRVKWVFWALLLSLSLISFAGFAADYVAGFPHPEVNAISGAILAVGLVCSSIAIFSKKHA